MHRGNDCFSPVPIPFAAPAASLALLLALAAGGFCQSRARETPPPPYLFDGVPAEPPGDISSPPVPDAEPPAPRGTGQPTPGVTTVRDLGSGDTALLSPAQDARWVTGNKVTIRWHVPEGATQVRFYYYGDRCKLGGRSRGSFDGIINGGFVPATDELQWKVPWLDGPYMNLRMAAYDDTGLRLGWTEHTVWLYPEEFDNLPDDCIAISKRRQRLYLVEDGKTVRMHMVSTAAGGYSTPDMKPGSYSRRRGAMGKVFRKAPNPFSSMYRVHMPHWLGITSSGSHGIHATSPRFYRRLGRPASHGCVRQHRSDARVLYSMVSVGMPVYIF